MAFSPDGKRILSGSWDGKVVVWDAATGKEVLTLNDRRRFRDVGGVQPHWGTHSGS
jgi:WD40 repeat protein